MDEKGATLICQAITATDSVDLPPPISARPMYWIVVSGGTPGSMIRLGYGLNRVGRSRENQVNLLDASISRRHATVITDANGDVFLTDLSSTNGTFLNGASLTSHLPYRLRDGDRIQLGASLVVKFVRLDPCEEQFHRDLFERTVRDPLTGLYNRSYFLDQIDTLADLGASRGLGLAVLMLDIDHFKRVNDTYGHDAGDAVLREVSAVLRDSTRSEDLVARYGGEEFVAALPVAAPDQAMARAEKIRSNLATRRIRLTQPGPDPLIPFRVTASIGLAFVYPNRPRSPQGVITAADQCLYQAKKAGRNRVVFRGDPLIARILESEAVTPASVEY